MKSKLEQYNQSYKKALGTVIYKLIPDIGSLSVTDVLLDPSFQHGRVWLHASTAALARIQAKRVDIQNSLARYVKTRYTPKLTFVIDDRYLEQMDQLFHQVEQDEN